MNEPSASPRKHWSPRDESVDGPVLSETRGGLAPDLQVNASTSGMASLVDGKRAVANNPSRSKHDGTCMDSGVDMGILESRLEAAIERNIMKTLTKQHNELLSALRLMIPQNTMAPVKLGAYVSKESPGSVSKESPGSFPSAVSIIPEVDAQQNANNPDVPGIVRKRDSKYSVYSAREPREKPVRLAKTITKQLESDTDRLALALGERSAKSRGSVVGRTNSAMREQILIALGAGDAEDCSDWLEETALERILGSPSFELIVGATVCTNALFIGWEVEYSTSHPEMAATPMYFVVISYMYIIFFLIELILRLAADFRGFLWLAEFKQLVWNYLDIFLVAASLIEVGLDVATFHNSKYNSVSMSSLRIVRMVRVFRLIRLLRIARFIRFVRALRTLVYSVLFTLKSVFWAMVLLGVIIYVFAILFTQAAHSHLSVAGGAESIDIPNMKRYWGTIGKSMLTLFMSICDGMSWVNAVEPLSSAGTVWTYTFLMYIGFVYFAVLNVVTGVFCQAAMESNSEDHDSMLQTFLRHKELYANRFTDLFAELDKEDTGRITFEKFVMRVGDEDVRNYFNALELDSTDALSLFDIFDDAVEEGIKIEEFVMGCLRLKGSARSSDMVRLLHENRLMMAKLNDIADHFQVNDAQRLPQNQTFTAVVERAERSDSVHAFTNKLSTELSRSPKSPRPSTPTG